MLYESVSFQEALCSVEVQINTSSPLAFLRNRWRKRHSENHTYSDASWICLRWQSLCGLAYVDTPWRPSDPWSWGCQSRVSVYVWRVQGADSRGSRRQDIKLLSLQKGSSFVPRTRQDEAFLHWVQVCVCLNAFQCGCALACVTMIKIVFIKYFELDSNWRNSLCLNLYTGHFESIWGIKAGSCNMDDLYLSDHGNI